MTAYLAQLVHALSVTVALAAADVEQLVASAEAELDGDGEVGAGKRE